MPPIKAVIFMTGDGGVYHYGFRFREPDEQGLVWRIYKCIVWG